MNAALLGLVLLMLLGVSGAGEVRKCRDENGRILYSDTLCMEGAPRVRTAGNDFGNSKVIDKDVAAYRQREADKAAAADEAAAQAAVYKRERAARRRAIAAANAPQHWTQNGRFCTRIGTNVTCM